MNKNSGFSLIEILVVITIIGLLIGLSAGALTGFLQTGEEAKTEALINKLQIYADEHANVTGDYPPSSLKHIGVNSTGDVANEGIEAFVVALFRKGYNGARPQSESDLVNIDEDSADKNITSFGNAVLLEFQDAWLNPIIYINCRDYGEKFSYLIGPEEAWEPVEVQALVNPVTGSYYNFDSYQIISAGADCIFDTEDDLANFERQE